MAKWEVSVAELKRNGSTEYKVTRRFPDMSVSETKVFKSKKEAMNQVEEWLS